ncbi:MAG TPA: adenylate/guanylate cyclase domain-containing protein [Trichocoleus sp.]
MAPFLNSPPATALAANPLAAVEFRLRSLLPADLYAATWIEPSAANLMRVFEHLRTLQHILIDYVPRSVSQQLPSPGISRHAWQKGTLLFTDLAGFTPLLEARAAEGRAGAELLLDLLNRYFAVMIEIISKSGGSLLEFTGDALLVEFTAIEPHKQVEQAIHAGLRMQRAMTEFAQIETSQGALFLKMRVGLHVGRFVKADIGTPLRMGHVLLGQAVQLAKQAEGAGAVGRVSLTAAAKDLIQKPLTLEPGALDHWLVVDDLPNKALGEYDITLNRRRAATPMLFDRSPTGLLSAIESALGLVEPLACYLPRSVLQLVVENAAQRKIPPAFPTVAVAFVNLIGLPEAVDVALPEETEALVTCFAKAFSLINGAVELRGGILQKVTYHSIGSEMLIHFGVLNPDPSDPLRAADAMLAIRRLIETITPPLVQGQPIRLTYRIGLTYGPVFAAEIGEPRGRREFNILGDTVNTAARLMGQAGPNEILINQPMQDAIASHFSTQPLGRVGLKGKADQQAVYTLAAM